MKNIGKNIIIGKEFVDLPKSSSTSPSNGKHINHSQISKSRQSNVILDEGCINCTKGKSSWQNCLVCSNNAKLLQKVREWAEKEIKEHNKNYSKNPSLLTKGRLAELERLMWVIT